MKYLLIDTANMFFRARHVAARNSDSWERVGYALHITLAAINKVYQKFNADHVIFALEGRSWRKDFYEPYKKNRAVARAALTEEELKEDALFWKTYDELTQYLRDKTNCSVLQQPQAEADDIIARWITLHPGDEHYIISSDTDFVQLLANNVHQYNGISDELITITGIYDHKGDRVLDKKTKLPKPAPNPGWLLFEKCVRGDPTDNVFSAFPGVRTKGSKNKVGLTEAYADKEKQGFTWNNLMLQRWTDHNNVEHRVLDDYTRNRVLIDLSAQPTNVKQAVDEAILSQVTNKHRDQVGSYFLKFCGKYELNKVSEAASQYCKWLNHTYQGNVHDYC
jgi:5'-3' exonuclease